MSDQHDHTPKAVVPGIGAISWNEEPETSRVRFSGTETERGMKAIRVTAPQRPATPPFVALRDGDTTRTYGLPTGEPQVTADADVECGEDCTCCDFCGEAPTEDLPVATNGKGSICRNCAADVVQLYADREPPATYSPTQVPQALVDQVRAALSLRLGAGGGSLDLETTIRVVAAETMSWAHP